MAEDISRTLKKKSLDGIFNEVVHNEKLEISNNEELRLFYLAVRGNKFYTEDLQTALYRNIGRYVFSRAALEDFHINDDDDSIISQALKVMSENGEFDAKGTGNELGEMLIYAMLEEMLGARKLMSRVEIDSNPLSNGSECESIHLLSGTDSNGKISYEMVFGASNIIGDIKDAIDNAFEEIERIEKHGNKDIKMVEKTALSGFYNKSEIDFIKKHIIPEPGKSGDYEIAYGVFLGYTLGLNSTGLSSAEYKEKVNRRLELDIKQHASYIANKIITKGLDGQEKAFATFCKQYLTIPADKSKTFFLQQKNIYDRLSSNFLSYSAPTSMGKSFIMHMFIKEQIMNGVKMNFARIVPTKALINEMRNDTINDLKNILEEQNYRVVTAASDISLEEEHNFILIMTPERLLYFLISNPDFQLDYLFIDEAHKIGGRNSRGPFYYKVVDLLSRKKQVPHFIFASPNIPNPEEYLTGRFLEELLQSRNHQG